MLWAIHSSISATDEMISLHVCILNFLVSPNEVFAGKTP